MTNFIKGFITGFLMATPAGPLAVLTLKRSLTYGYARGLATALGIALADGFYSLIATIGLTTVSGFITGQKEYFFMWGGLLLLFLGARALRNPPTIHTEVLSEGGFLSTLLHTMLVTLTNPMTLLLFTTAFSAIGFEGDIGTADQALLICSGVFLGSITWFAMISIIAASLRRWVTPRMITLINTISGSLLLFFGFVLLIDAGWELLSKTYR